MKTAFVYSTDENYVKLTAVSMCSLLKHNPGASVVILASRISPDSQLLFSKLAASYGGYAEIIDVDAKLEEVKSLGAGSYVSFSAYSRLFIPTLLDCHFERAVYIDGDTLIADSLAGLCNLELKGKPFAIGYDCICNSYKKLIGLTPEKPYFNSGVLLLDLAQWSRNRCTERILETGYAVDSTSHKM